MKNKIFLSYRRDDSRGYTTAIYTLLELHFGSDQLFMDVDTLLPGTDFVKALEDAVEECDIFLAIIGPSWETIRDNNGIRRLDKQEDFVRVEIAHALQRGIPVIPVLVGGAQMPAQDNLPDNLKDLARRHAFSIGDFLRSDVQQLIKVLEKTFNQLKEGDESKEPNESETRPKSQEHFHLTEKKKPLKESRGEDTAKTDQQENKFGPLTFFDRLPVWVWGSVGFILAVIGFIFYAGFPKFESEIPEVTGSSSVIVSPTKTNSKLPTSTVTLSSTTLEPTTEPKTKTTTKPTTEPTIEPSLIPTENPTQEPLDRDVFKNPIDGALMVYVPAGEFVMGSEEGEKDERPVHIVYLDGYWIYKTEVNGTMYRYCIEAGACDENEQYDVGDSDYPVFAVSWEDASTYCHWAGGKLPTEAEWEKAARGTEGLTYPWGEEVILANYNSSGTVPVGYYSEAASPYGVLNMAGNVSEWVDDWYQSDFYSISPYRNPLGPETGLERVVRGGSYKDNLPDIRSSNRSSLFQQDSSFSIGFRCASSQQP